MIYSAKRIKQLVLSVLILVSASAMCVAQRPGNARLPTVAVLRDDEPAGSNHDGCGNHIMNLRGTYKAIFISDSEGWDAWMNLNGHNVELTLKETHRWHIARWYDDAVYKYRYRNILVTLKFRESSDYISAVPATLIVQAGHLTRRYRVEVGAQCD